MEKMCKLIKLNAFKKVSILKMGDTAVSLHRDKFSPFRP